MFSHSSERKNQNSSLNEIDSPGYQDHQYFEEGITHQAYRKDRIIRPGFQIQIPTLNFSKKQD